MRSVDDPTLLDIDVPVISTKGLARGSPVMSSPVAAPQQLAPAEISDRAANAVNADQPHAISVAQSTPPYIRNLSKQASLVSSLTQPSAIPTGFGWKFVSGRSLRGPARPSVGFTAPSVPARQASPNGQGMEALRREDGGLQLEIPTSDEADTEQVAKNDLRAESIAVSLHDSAFCQQSIEDAGGTEHADQSVDFESHQVTFVSEYDQDPEFADAGHDEAQLSS